MARKVAAPNIETPTLWWVESYAVIRSGEHAEFVANYAEGVPLTDAEGVAVNNSLSGAPAYRHIQTGRRWSIRLNAGNEEARAYMGNLLGEVAMDICTQGTDPDSAIAARCEALEDDRVARKLPFAVVGGDPPPMDPTPVEEPVA